MPSCLPQSSLRFPLVTLCVQEHGLSVRWCVCMCLCVCDWERASVFRRCCFPQPWSNSVVTQSPCERFPASVLPPVGRLSLAGWVAECVWRRPAQSHWTPHPHPLPLLSAFILPSLPSGLIYYVNRWGCRQQQRSQPCLRPVRTPSWHLIPVTQQLLEWTVGLCAVCMCLLMCVR